MCGSSKVRAFAAGDVFSGPTMFLMRNGEPAVLGEKGAEGIFPLVQGPRGLSVKSNVMGGLLPVGRIGGDLGVKMFASGDTFGIGGPGGRSGGFGGTTIHAPITVTIRADGGVVSPGASRRSARQVANDMQAEIRRASGG